MREISLLRCVALVAYLMTVVTFPLGQALAADRTPLLQPGKKTLYQRVLTRPGAELVERPGATGGGRVTAFSRYYVYGEQAQGGQRWLEVGLDTRGTVKGWLRAVETVPWLQQMALAFTNPGAQRERALFFDSWDSLNRLMALPDPAAEAVPLTRQITAGGRDPRVVAIEPDRYIDINSHFYLLPILDFHEVLSEAGFPLRGLKVASVSESLATPPPAQSAAAVQPPMYKQLSSFRAAVVFVIDSTISMQQYIDEARAAVRKVYGRIQRSGLLDKVAFGLVAYRSPSSDPVRARQLEYVSRLFVDPSQVENALDFLAQTSALTEAKVSTDHFDEDPYAGVLKALETIPWNRFGARYLVLISDAGALEGKDSETGLHAEQVRSEASAKGVAVLVLHLKTPPGKTDHAKAQAQYQTLSHNEAIQRPLYFPVQGGSVQGFGQAVGTLAEAVVDNIQAAARGQLAAGSARTAKADGGAHEEEAESRRLREATSALGHAMQLAYLGRQEGTTAPPVFEGWISDRDLVDPTVRTVDERVLLTKDQLSDLHRILKQIVEAADAGMLAPDAFFDSLRSLAAPELTGAELAAMEETLGPDKLSRP